MQGFQFCAENVQALSRNAIGPAALLGRERRDPAQLLQAGNRTIQRSRTQTSSAKARDVFDHRVSVLRSTGKAGKHKQRRVGIVPRSRAIFRNYYVSRTTHDVVIAQLAFLLQGNYWDVGRKIRMRRSTNLRGGGQDAGLANRVGDYPGRSNQGQVDRVASPHDVYITLTSPVPILFVSPW